MHQIMIRICDFRKIFISAIVILLFTNLFYEESYYAWGLGDITVRWNAPSKNEDGSSITDLSGYKLYYGTEPGTYTEWIDVGTVLNYQFNNLDIGKTYYFALKAYDKSGNESRLSDELSKTALDSTPPVTSLMKGFNLVSSPSNTSVIPDAFTYLGVMDNSGTKIEKIERYDKSSASVQVAYYNPDKTTGGTNFSIVAGEGIVVYVKENMDITMSQNVCPSFDMKAGINWVGTPCKPDHVSAFALLEVLGENAFVTNMQRFNKDTGRFESASYNNGQPIGVDFPINAGEGYLIYMKQEKLGFKP